MLTVQNHKLPTGNTVEMLVEKDKQGGLTDKELSEFLKRGIMSHYEYVPNFLLSSEIDCLTAFVKYKIPWKHVVYKKKDRGEITTPRLTCVAVFTLIKCMV